MILKVNGKYEQKLGIIAKASKLKNDDLFENIIKGFIDRYEIQKGKIKIPATEKELPIAHSAMYEVFKKHYYNNLNSEYVVDFKQRNIDLRNLKLLRDKIINFITQNQDPAIREKEVITIDDQSAAIAFEFIVTKMPEWWKINMMTPSGLYKNFEKIMLQINNGRRSGKDALDDFLGSFQ